MNQKLKKIMAREGQIILGMIAVALLLIGISSAEQNQSSSKEKNMLLATEATAAFIQTKSNLSSWTDEKMTAYLRTLSFDDNSMNNLYNSFMETIVSPPNPDEYETYSINDAENALVKTDLLGRNIHNLLFALSKEDIDKYGKLLHMMRDVLYLDSQHIPLAIKHDNSRDAYWYKLHNVWVSEAEILYKKLNIGK